MAIRKGFLKRHRAYKNVFETPEGEIILADLAKFCGASQPNFHVDPGVMAMREGRREVFLRIMSQLNINLKRVIEIENKQGDLND